MTNRTSPPNMTRGVKKPRLRRVEITFPGSPEPILNNGRRPHGGYRGTRPCPPGQFSHNKDDGYQEDLNEELRHLLDNEQFEKVGGSPFWLSEIQKETTHSGESPLFTNKLLATGKFEQEHGFLKFERALLGTRHKRLWSAPNRRKGQKQFFRQNRTHQYLSATDLRRINDADEYVIKYGRPTRTTLLRAMQRSNSAPVNAYDIRRENMRRVEDLRNHSLFYTSKEVFDREQTRIRYRFFNIYSSDGQTMHSFLTGARYNRAHLLDSRGLEVYGVYMPRENPAGSFMTGLTRGKDPGEEIPSAPPDSPRSDIGDTPSPEPQSRPDSSKITGSRPTSSRTGSSLPTTRTPPSRPPSYRQMPGSRPKSASWEPQPHVQGLRPPPKSSEGTRRFPEEVTMHVPDHINPKGKTGVYVTLKGQKMLETVESKLPRVTGISLPKLRKRHDAVEETIFVNQPPPTPVDASLGSLDRNKFDALHGENYQQATIEPIINEELNSDSHEQKDSVPNAIVNKPIDQHKEVKFADNIANIDLNDGTVETEKEQSAVNEQQDIKHTYGNKNENPVEQQAKADTAKQTEQTEDSKHKIIHTQENLELNETFDERIIEEIQKENIGILAEESKENENNEKNNNANLNEKDDNVVFFVTEEQYAKSESELKETIKILDNGSETSDSGGEEEEEKASSNAANNGTIESVIRVEVSESEKKETSEGQEPDRAITSEDFPFTDNKPNDDRDFMV